MSKEEELPMNPQRILCRPCRRIFLTLVLPLALLIQPATAPAEDQNGGAPGAWLSNYTGARTLGLGGAFVATADEPLGVVWNPAGLSRLDQNEARFETARLFEGTSVNGLSFAVPGSRLPSFGVSMIHLSSGDFERTNELNDPLGTFNTGDTAFLLTTAKNISPRLSVGGSLKVVRQSVEEYSGGGVGVDLGAIYEVMPNVSVGLSMLNLAGPSIKLRDTEESFPIEFRTGLATSFLGGRALVSAEIDQISGQGVRLRGGSEYWMQPSIGLRVGYDDRYPAGGFSYRFARGLQIDYGITDHDLGINHRVGVAYRFGGFFARSQAVPDVFSPTGEQSVTKIELQSRTKAEAKDWGVSIVSKSDQVVRRFAGKGVPPAHLVWDGKDETGLPLPDGFYRYRLVVHDDQGREVSSSNQMVEIATSGPQGTIEIVPGGGPQNTIETVPGDIPPDTIETVPGD
jgi:hypothetical protein